MPTVLRIGAYQFSFYSNERREPPHVHVKARGHEAKLWLADLRVARSHGFADHELREIARLVYENHDVISKRWVQHLGRA